MAEIMKRGTTVYRVAKEGAFPIQVRKVTDLYLEDGKLVLILDRFDPKTDCPKEPFPRDEEKICWPVDNLFLSYTAATNYRKERIRQKAEELGTEPKETLLERIFFLLGCEPNPKEEMFWLKPQEEDRLCYYRMNEKAKGEYVRALLEVYVEKEEADHEEN